jgi:lysophospholipase L1-like esterase
MCKVLVVGSSIFEQWERVADVMPDCTVKNRAVGGTTTDYWVAHLLGVLREETPAIVLLYCGSNDLNNLESNVAEETIVANVIACRAILSQEIPSAHLVYFGIIKAPQKLGKWAMIDRINAQIADNLPVGDLYIESNAVFFDRDQPVAHYFIEDGLHHNAEAYAALCEYAQPLLAAWRGVGNEEE